MPSPRSIAVVILLMAGALFVSAPEKPPTPSLVPVDATELRNRLPGRYIRDCYGPVDSGPLILQSDGAFEKVTGFGSYYGKYEISNGAATFRGTLLNGEPGEFTIWFYRDAGGTLHYSMEHNTPRPVDLRAIDRHFRSLGCPAD